MTATALQDIAKGSSLRKAWLKISRGKLAQPGANRIGNDGQSLHSFSARLDAELTSLSGRLQTGKFKFSPLDPFFLPKPDGKDRVICVPTVGDRVVQRAILDAIVDRQSWQVNSVSYGFVREGGVERAAKKAIEYRAKMPWAFKTDITKFFDNVNRDLLKEKVKRQIRQTSVHALLFDAIDCEIRPRKDSHIVRIKKLGIAEGRGVRQGMPVSPLLANLFLADFDKKCEKQKIAVLRYADDLIFFAESEADAIAHQQFCAAELAGLELEIPALVSGAKSQVYAPGQAAEFLGVELACVAEGSYQVRLGQKQFDGIKNKLYTLGDLAELRRRGLDMTRFGNSLAARVAAYSSGYSFCSNKDQLDASLNDWSKATVSRVGTALGINVSTLSEDGKWFLGLVG